MDKRELIEIVDLGNILKSTFIAVIGNFIIGTDESLTYYKIIPYNNINNYTMLFNSNDMKTFVKELNLINGITLQNRYIISTSGDSIEVFDNDKLVFINNALNSINQIVSTTQISYSNNNIREDENFEKILEYKTGDGVGAYIIESDRKYLLSVYKNMLPVAKKDKISLEIRNLGDTFLATYMVYKPKNIIITVYIMYRHL